MKRVKSTWVHWQGKRFHIGFKTNRNHCWKWQLLKYDYPQNTLYRFWRFFLIRYKMIPVTVGVLLSEKDPGGDTDWQLFLDEIVLLC